MTLILQSQNLFAAAIAFRLNGRGKEVGQSVYFAVYHDRHCASVWISLSTTDCHSKDGKQKQHTDRLDHSAFDLFGRRRTGSLRYQHLRQYWDDADRPPAPVYLRYTVYFDLRVDSSFSGCQKRDAGSVCVIFVRRRVYNGFFPRRRK